MGFSPVALVQQVHNRQVTHITRSNNTFNQTQYTKHNIKGHKYNIKVTLSLRKSGKWYSCPVLKYVLGVWRHSSIHSKWLASRPRRSKRYSLAREAAWVIEPVVDAFLFSGIEPHFVSDSKGGT
jgi:hypothetical protein